MAINAAARRRIHGGNSVAVEPHPTTRRDGVVINVQSTPQWTHGQITCGDCGGRLLFGRDGLYRHQA